MEVIVLLKLEVDSEQFNNDTDDNLGTKIRAYVADIVSHTINQQEHRLRLVSSSVVAEIEPSGTFEIQPSNLVKKLPDPDIKMQ